MVRALGIGLTLTGMVLVLGACAGTGPESSPGRPLLETAGPRLQRLDGEAVALADLVGNDRPILLVFMTAWCPTCLEEQPRVEQLARETANRLTTYFVLSGSTLESARELAEDRNLGLELLVDARGEVADDLEVEGTPTLILFGGDGRRVGTFSGPEQARVELARLAQVDPGPRRVEDTGVELGTSYDVVVLARDERRARADLAALREYLSEQAAIFSEWRADSEISRVNREARREAVECSAELYRLLQGSLHVAEATRGAFDVTWRPLGELWDRAEARGTLPTEEELAAAREAVGWQNVRLEEGTVRFRRPDVQLGIAGVAKGWIIDALADRLREAGYEDFVVNLGGDLRAEGKDLDGRAWRIDVRDPFDSSRVVTTLEVTDAAVATSGNRYRHRTIDGRRYGHLLDPRTGRPAELAGSVTVITPDAAMADALATALYVLGLEEGLAFARSQPRVEALFVTREGVSSSLAEPDRPEAE